MTQKFQTMDELFSEYEAERLAKGKAEQAAEDAAWLALPQAEKDRILAERQAKMDALEAAWAESPDEDEDDEDEEED